MAIQYGFDMYNDKKRGCSTRELEQKYKCSRVAISMYVDKVDKQLWNNPASPVFGQKDKIMRFIDSLVIMNVSEADNAD